MSKALVILSGGQDSTTCLFMAKSTYDEIETITFDYGQRHKAELISAKKIAHLAGVPNEIIYVKDVLKGTSPLVNLNEPVERYKDAASLPGGLEKTFVPSRNMLFLTIASNRAYVLNCDVIIIGVSQEDYGGYPDCRDEFIQLFESSMIAGLDRDISIITPLMHASKAETVHFAKETLGCWEALSFSHSCYEGAVPPCGSCHACLLRAKGFKEAGYADPLIERLEQSLEA